MVDWLHADLQANTQPWVIVYFHQPPYTDGSHDSGQFYEVFMKTMRENFAEIFEQTIKSADLSIPIGNVIRPPDPLFSVARGCYIAAEASLT